MNVTFDADLFEWRGPAPFCFARVPDGIAAEIKELAPTITYGWGVIPASVTIGTTTFTTSLFPKDGGYLVPIKVAVQRAEYVGIGDNVTFELKLGR